MPPRNLKATGAVISNLLTAVAQMDAPQYINTHTLGALKHKNVPTKPKNECLKEKHVPDLSRHSKIIQKYYLILDNISTKVPH